MRLAPSASEPEPVAIRAQVVMRYDQGLSHAERSAWQRVFAWIMASMLLGYPAANADSQSTVTVSSPFVAWTNYYGAYAQDDWRVSPNVTVNAGVRWEPFIPLRNTYSWASNFDQARFNAGIRSTVYPQAPAGLMFPGDEGYPGRGTTESKMAQFAPRLGAIWTPGGDGNTSIAVLVTVKS